MRKLSIALLAAACSLLTAYPTSAADQNPPPPKKVVKATPAPVIGTSPFALGASLGMALSPTENLLTINGQLQGDGPVKGYPIGPLAGIIASYQLIPIGPAYVSATAEVHYDFSRGCVGDACQAERKNGFLLQQGLEAGLTTAQINGALPTSGQPANWPVPIIVPTDVASNLKLAARGGFAERWLSLCAVIDQVGDYGCAPQFLWAPYGGLKIGFMASTNSEIGVVWDHIFWKQGNSFTPNAAVPLFSSTVAIKQEDDIKLQWLYHF